MEARHLLIPFSHSDQKHLIKDAEDDEEAEQRLLILG